MGDYSLPGYGAMVRDRVRMRGFEEALRRHVTPRSVVLDIGCGPGVLSFFACRLGARRVYAVDPDPAIAIGRRIARDNGLAQIEFRQARIQDVHLDEPADIVVEDIRGILPIFDSHFEVVEHARTHLMKPGGVQIPLRDELYLALADSREAYDALVGAWTKHHYGLDASYAIRKACDRWLAAKLAPDEIVSGPQHLVTLDYRGDLPARIERTLSWTIERECTANGVYLWWDCHLADGVSFSASPFAAERPQVYGSGLLPWPRPTRLGPGFRVEVALLIARTADGHAMAWDTTVSDESGRTRGRTRQSTFGGELLSPEQIVRADDAFRPELSAEGRTTLAVLEGIRAGRTLGEIATLLCRQEPDEFPDRGQALRRVGVLAKRYALGRA